MGSGKLFAASPSHRINERLVRVAHKVLEGSGFPIFFSHEQKRHIRGEEYYASGQLSGLERDQPAQALASRAVSHLVVILGKDHEAVPGDGS
jgi:hypothetical protein